MGDQMGLVRMRSFLCINLWKATFERRLHCTYQGTSWIDDHNTGGLYWAPGLFDGYVTITHRFLNATLITCVYLPCLS